MSEISNFANGLRSIGLYAGTDTSVVLVGLPRDPLPSDEEIRTVTRFGRDVRLERWDFPDGTVFLEDATYVEHDGERWSFRNLLPNHFGGYNPDSVRCYRNTLDQMMPVVDAYYFGKPVVITDWVIPVFQHPDWDLERVTHAVNSAKLLTYHQAAALMDERASRISERRARASGDELWSTCGDLMYYEAKRVRKSAPLLFLRVDCKEALTCTELTATEKSKLGEFFFEREMRS